MKPQNKVSRKWSRQLAYIIGLIATDGNLSNDGRHINFTSKDNQLIEIFKESLKLTNKIGLKSSGSSDKKYFRIQFGDITFYNWLLSIGITPTKSKTIERINIPDKYFFDFLRGHFDGDGTFYSYWDKRWKSSFMFYTVFISASKNHIDWLRLRIEEKLNIKGHVTKSINSSAYQLKYAKSESLKLLPKIYYNKNIICLSRKQIKIEKAPLLNN